MLTEKQIEKFQNIYKKTFKKEINKKDAFEQGEKLIRLVKLAYKPISKEEYEKINKGRQGRLENNSNYKNGSNRRKYK